MKEVDWKEAGEELNEGKIGIVPTDTLYGISASIRFPKAVEKIYQIKKRDTTKPFIILISSLKDLNLFGVSLDYWQKNFLGKVWPGKNSVIFKINYEDLAFLHRGKKSLAFRFPKDDRLLKLINNTGPIVSTTVNVEGEEPAKDTRKIGALQKKLDFFINEGILIGASSSLVDLSQKNPKILRRGDNASFLENQLF